MIKKILIVGAGVSGIGHAVSLKKAFPDIDIDIMEARADMGGTWSFFDYPGMRSDSDMFTYSYSFKPWTGRKTIADKNHIKSYLQDVVDSYQLKKIMHFNHKVTYMNWDSQDNQWHVTIQHQKKNLYKRYNIVILGCGYFNYEKPYQPRWNIEAFQGEVIHPQFWPKKKIENKNITIIGSGATAITLFPELAKNNRVTLLQRSPTYIVSQPDSSLLYKILSKLLPRVMASKFMKWVFVTRNAYIYHQSTKKPEKVHQIVINEAKKNLPKDFDIKHFTPRYNVWDQRVCLDLNTDFFQAVSQSQNQIVTDHIASFEADGILCKSGQHIPSDVIVTATGFNAQFFGDITISVDHEIIQPHQHNQYLGMMLDHVPNLSFTFGYINASWTLKVDIISELLIKIITALQKNNQSIFVAKKPYFSSQQQIPPFGRFSPSYIAREQHNLPKVYNDPYWGLLDDYPQDKKLFASLSFPNPHVTITNRTQLSPSLKNKDKSRRKAA